MVGELYDHMIGLVITGIIAVSAIIVIPNLSYVNLLYVDQQQLRNVAMNTLKAMLLDAGYPANWGSTQNFDPDQVERFGLALAGSSSFFVLDPDKVQRLVVGNPAGIMEYEDIRGELKLQGYGFNFQIIPPFKVIVNDEDFDDESDPISLEELVEGVEVFVTYNDGNPIPNALLEGRLFYILNKNNYYTVKASNNTNALGKGIVKPDILQNPDDITDFVIVFKVTIAGVATVTSSYMEGFEEQHVMNASIVGDNITMSIPEGPGWEKGSSGVRWIESVVVVNEEGYWTIFNGTSDDKIQWSDSQDSWGWSKIFSGLSYYNPLFVIINLNVPNPRRFVLYLGPEPNWKGSRVEAFGAPTGAIGASSAVKVQRDVIISGLTYIAELTLWKESP